MLMTMIALSEIGESPANPRRAYDAEALSDLADSIREQGVLEPLLVRPLPVPRPAGRIRPYEVVAGHRRLRAARAAGLAEVPCVVHEMDDAQALEAALVENGQREDVTPLDEAHAFGALVKLGRSAEDIASRIGRSVGYVRSRLRLLDLTDEVRALLEEGRIHVGSALLLAQVHEVQQREAAERIRSGVYRPRRDHDEPFTSADVASLLAERSRRMHLAIWPLDDADLVPSAGACATCTRRTGSQRALLVEMEGDDQCLDAACWGAKTAATVERAREAGELVLEGPAHERAEDAGAYLSLDDDCEEQDFPEAHEGQDEDRERYLTWGDALARLGVSVSSWTLVLPPRGGVERWVSAGHLADLVEPHWPDAARLLRQRMRDLEASLPATTDTRPRYTSGDEADGDAAELDDVETTAHAEEERARRAASEKAEREKAEAERRAQARARADITARVVAWAETHMPAEGTEWLHALTRVALAQASAEACVAILARRGLVAGQLAKTSSSYEAARKGIETWLVTQVERGPVAGLLAELIITDPLRSQWLFHTGGPDGAVGPYRILLLLGAVGAPEPGMALREAKKALAREEAAKAKKKPGKGSGKVAKKVRSVEATDGA